MAAKVPTSRTVAGHSLSDDVVLSAGDVGAEVAGLSDATKSLLSDTYTTPAEVAEMIANLSAGPGFDQVLGAPDAADMPTISISTTSSIANGAVFRPLRNSNNPSQIDMVNDTRFRYDGTPSLTVTSNVNFANAPTVPTADVIGKTVPFINRFHFLTPYTDRVEVSFRPPSSTNHRYRLSINERHVTPGTQGLAALTTGVEYFMTLVFPSAAVRLITWESPTRLQIGGCVVPAGLAPMRPATPSGPRVAFIGDSYTDGAGGPPDGATRVDTWAGMFAKAYGAKEWAQWGIGGTGWQATAAPFIGRVPSVLDYKPDVVIILGSINDGTAYSEGLRAAVKGVLDGLSTVPKVYVIGAQLPAYSQNNEAVRAAALVAGRPFFDMLRDPWLNPATDLGPDAIHPTFAGHQKIAKRAFAVVPKWEAPAGGAAPVVSGATTTTAIEAVPTTASVGDSVTLTATTTPTGAAGTVQFKDNTTVIGSSAVSGGSAALTWIPSNATTRTLTATFIPSDATAYQQSTGVTAISVLAAYPLGGVDDYSHRYLAEKLTGEVGSSVTTMPDLAGSRPLAGDYHFKIAQIGDEKVVSVIGDGASGKLFEPTPQGQPFTIITVMRILIPGRILMQNDGYNLSRAANGSWQLAGRGGTIAAAGSSDWSVVAFSGNSDASVLQVGSNVVSPGTITGPGVTGSTYPAGMSLPASSLANSEIGGFAEIVFYPRLLTPEERNTAIVAMQEHYTLV